MLFAEASRHLTFPHQGLHDRSGIRFGNTAESNGEELSRIGSQRCLRELLSLHFTQTLEA